MKAIIGCMLLLVFLGVVVIAAAVEEEQKPTQTAKTPQPDLPSPATEKLVIEPKATELLKAACSHLAAARSMSFTAVITYEHPSLLGPPLAYTTKSEVTLQRPNKLRVITPADGPATEFYYDGKIMMAFAPVENLVAIADAPPTIDDLLKAAYDKAGIYFPFTDIIIADPYKDIADGLKVAYYIGQSHVVGGTTTDMVAYGSEAVFLQIWIDAADKLPRMIRAVFRDDPSKLRHQVEFSNWKLEPAVSADDFKSSKAAGAKRIQFAAPNPPATEKPKEKQ